MSTNNASAPKKKKGRGRPKIEVIAELQHFEGSKMERLQQLYDQWFNCKRCFLGEHRALSGGSEDIVFGGGNPDAHILIVGEAPGEEEENQLVPFVGQSGHMLNQILAMTSGDPEIRELATWYNKATRNQMNFKKFHSKMLEWRDKEFFFTNVVSCRPPENRTPNQPEIRACWERLWNIIYIVDPLLIIAVGKTALGAVMRKLQVEIMKKRGELQDAVHDGRFGKMTYPVMPVLHPSFLLRVADWRQKDGYYDKTIEDWRRALKVVDFLREKHFGTPPPNRERIL